MAIVGLIGRNYFSSACFQKVKMGKSQFHSTLNAFSNKGFAQFHDVAGM
jgi:hypothetical protein